MHLSSLIRCPSLILSRLIDKEQNEGEKKEKQNTQKHSGVDLRMK